MQKVAIIFVLLVALIAPAAIFAPVAYSQDVEAVATAAKPSVAVILAETPGGVTSGTAFMAADRLVVTAYHVIEGARRILMKFPDHPAVDARVVSTDRTNDVAVLSIPPLLVRPLPLGDISEVREGQTIVVIGFPRIDSLGAQTATISQGIVSAVRPGLLQIQAPVSPGNSGGPVLTLRGDVVGIVEATLKGEQQGINFAAQINVAKRLLGSAILTAAAPTPVPPTPTPVPVTPPASTSPPAPPPLGGTNPTTPSPASPFSVLPGKAIGPIVPGVAISDIVAVLGAPKAPLTRGSTTTYAWYEFVENQPGNVSGGYRHEQEGGLLAYASRNGMVTSVGIYFDSRYVTPEGLHTRDRRYASEGGKSGSKEEDIRAALGEPTRTSVQRGPKGEPNSHALVYLSRGVTFWIGDDPKSNGYNEVFEIIVYVPR